MLASALFALAAFSFGAPSYISNAPGVQDAPQDQSIVVTGEMNKKNKRLCKRAVATGSIMGKSTCKTVGEWEAEKVRNEIAAERLRGDQRWSEAARAEKSALEK